MSHSFVYCIATSRSQGATIVDRLLAAGFPNQSISVLFADQESAHDFAHEKHTKAPEGTVAGAGAGGAVGGTLGLLAGIGALAIPGVGPFVAAGPLLAALGGAAIGATVGGIAGGLIGMGLPEHEAKRYEGKLKQGNLLLSVHTDSRQDVDRAIAIFEESGAEDIFTAHDPTAPEPRGGVRRDDAIVR